MSLRLWINNNQKHHILFLHTSLSNITWISETKSVCLYSLEFIMRKYEYMFCVIKTKKEIFPHLKVFLSSLSKNENKVNFVFTWISGECWEVSRDGTWKWTHLPYIFHSLKRNDAKNCLIFHIFSKSVATWNVRKHVDVLRMIYNLKLYDMFNHKSKAWSAWKWISPFS
jgi:hypothetical protein